VFPLAGVINNNIDWLVTRTGWNVISTERYPKYDKITEFMNVALVPIGVLVALAMYALASCSTNFT
jgi:hypothetical protein